MSTTRLAVMIFRDPRKGLLLHSVLVAGGSYGTAFIGDSIAVVREAGGYLAVLFHAVVVMVLSALGYLVLQLAVSRRDVNLHKRAQVMATAHSQADAYVSKEVARFKSLAGESADVVPHAPKVGIDELVEGLYSSLDAHYSDSDVPGERINFEVTFMTRVAKDEEITILSWANREHRAPRSLAQQEAGAPGVYDSTVTAALYRESRSQQPLTKIIEDTDKDAAYAELYPGQKTRIKSSVVHPVLSAESELLGTLVVHCDKSGFFSVAEMKYWRDLMEIYSFRIALEKVRLDWQNSRGSTS